MTDSSEYKILLGKLTVLQMQAGWNNPNNYLNEIPKIFNEREIKILIEGNALPANYKDLLNK